MLSLSSLKINLYNTLMGGASGPALSLDFLSGTLDSRVTFTRASTATFFNSSGVLTSAAIDTPRFDYDPATLLPKGLLIEEQRTNSIRNNTMVGAVAGTPGTLPTNWFTFTALTGLTQQIVGVGTENGIQYVDFRLFGTPVGAPGNLTLFFETLSNTVAAPTQVWSNSAFVKLAGGSLANLSVSIAAQARTASTGFIEQYNGSATPTGTLSRLTVTTPALPASTERIESAIFFYFAAGVATDITLRIGLPQLELGAFATSVIPTTTAAATRAADNAVMTGTNFSSWYNQTEGTVVVDCDQVVGANSLGIPYAISDNTFSNSQYGLYFGGNSFRAANYIVGGVPQINDILTFTVTNVAVPLKDAFAYAVNNFGESLNGQTTRTSGYSAVVNTASNRMYIGSGWNGTGQYLNGHIRSIAYYPQRLPNATLQALTA